MKTSIKTFLSVLFLATILSSCNANMFNSVNGNENVLTENRTTKEDFNKITISTGLDLYITQGSKNKIIVEADENLHDIIFTEINDGVLKIYSEKNIWRAEAKKIHVTVTNLDAITATSGADVYTEEMLKLKSITVIATSGADIRLSLDTDSVSTTATSGAGIKIDGIANNHTATATSGASINGYDLESKNATVKVTSGADINIYASENIDAVATSGGDIDFKGNPKKVKKTSTSGGSISAK
tara:strand:+ start:183 stop:908 length:726 start_codon:yes stop_codon:yes gene_type:complete